ncbi:unnamed protein product [Rotaria magnacalcarata]|uniref:EF-hand domain-containing protein n=1 Tax=Rotaria magnacalcarata TaxID=392030 RepID=A0A8S2PST5_9BILA|nr:unnamed protein product [Rotaria magnacalcarata]
MSTGFSNELQQLQMELRAQNFDIIRFSTYRTACKLRFIQKKLNYFCDYESYTSNGYRVNNKDLMTFEIILSSVHAFK